MEEIIDLDLNQEPWEPHADNSMTTGLGYLLNDIGTVHGRIEERIQQLEALTSRAMQRRRRRQAQTLIQPTNPDVGEHHLAMITTDMDRNIESRDRSDWNNRRSNKRGSSHLIAKALEVEREIDLKKVESGSGGFFDCNICLDIPREPIVTCCGHMFCWPCFYRLPYDQSSVRECPVCKGEVADKSIIPVYGGSDTPFKSESEDSGPKVPPRPQSRRVETVRQQLRVGRGGPQLLTRGFSTFHIEEALRRVVSNRAEDIGPQELHDSQTTSDSVDLVNSQVSEDRISRIRRDVMRTRNRRLRVLQFSRLLSEEAASLTSLSTTLSSALNSVESMVDDLETIIHSGPVRNLTQVPSLNNRNSSTNAADVIDLEANTVNANATEAFSHESVRNTTRRIREHLDEIVGTSSMITRNYSQQTSLVDNQNPMIMAPEGQNISTDVPPTTNIVVENETTATTTGNSFTRVPSVASARRRSDVSNILDVDNAGPRESRRRRLR